MEGIEFEEEEEFITRPVELKKRRASIFVKLVMRSKIVDNEDDVDKVLGGLVLVLILLTIGMGWWGTRVPHPHAIIPAEYLEGM